MTATYANRICEGYEPIPGYVLEQRIGCGGFGEVWRASAPGGIKKAVKFVFGAQDQKGALRELRSLERIKGVTHPFLLTLERFEVVDNQLVIVTELADGSLEHEFGRRRDDGSCGIARDVLISYLHDAADALDYLHEKYQLQHLDIKPGNLLLVGGHVKVADFGLLKNLREADCSVIGGLTPVYAPPEVFDGRPSINSDQYSLAVMYQELLTGSRPFSGRTIAQLATQHVHSAPNLESLPPSDRPIVARALEKNPDRRFDSCKEFVEALKTRRGRPSASAATHAMGEENAAFDSESTCQTAAVEDLPQLSGDTASVTGAATRVMVVALGGTGMRCVQELSRRLSKTPGQSIDLHRVLIDTDRDAIDPLQVAESLQPDRFCTMIHTPLHTAHDYRHRDSEQLKSISRRWIYNVPRSGSTEGMRPLGRLALVDHGRQVIERLKAAIDGLASVRTDDRLRVYLVGSLTGGTASGMYLDVVHLLRHLMDHAGMEEHSILSLLSTSSDKLDPARPLASLNAQAALREMSHFMQAGNGYPGDTGAGWPSVPAARTPLKDVYLIPETTTDSAAPSATETINRYLWADLGGASDLLAEARRIESNETSSIASPSVRSVGAVPLNSESRLQQSYVASAVVGELLASWLGATENEDRDDSALADRVMRRIGLSPDAIMQATANYLAQEQRVRPILQAIGRLPRKQHVDRAAVTAAITPVVDSLLQENDLRSIATGVVNHLQREMFVGLHDRRSDVTALLGCLRTVHEQTRIAIGSLGKFHLEAPKSGDEAVQIFGGIATRMIAVRQLELVCSGVSWLAGRLESFAVALTEALAMVAKAQSAQESQSREMLQRVRLEFETAVQRLHVSSVDRYIIGFLTSPTDGAEGATIATELTRAVQPLLDQWIDSPVVNLDDQDPAELSLEALCEQTDLEDHFDTEQTPQSIGDQPMSIEEALVAVKPRLLCWGGLQRLILMVGTEQERERLEPEVHQHHQGSLTVAVIPGSTPQLIHEAQQIELKDILTRLTVLNGEHAQLTNRLASRSDVAW